MLWLGHDATPRQPAALGGVVRPRRVVRFARLMHRRGRAFWLAFAGAVCGGSVSLPWLPRMVVRYERHAAAQRRAEG